MRTFGKTKVKEKITQYFSGKKTLNAGNINKLFNFEDVNDCRRFLNNLYIGTSRVKALTLANGQEVKMEDIPEDQVIQRAKELRGWIFGKPELRREDDK